MLLPADSHHPPPLYCHPHPPPAVCLPHSEEFGSGIVGPRPAKHHVASNRDASRLPPYQFTPPPPPHSPLTPNRRGVSDGVSSEQKEDGVCLSLHNSLWPQPVLPARGAGECTLWRFQQSSPVARLVTGPRSVVSGCTLGHRPVSPVTKVNTYL